MSQKVKQTKHTVQDSGLQTVSRFMQILFALVQILLVFRFAFKLLGANASNVFVNLIYATTAPLVGLFEGIFPEMIMEDNALFAVFEPATVIAIIVTAAVSYIVLRLLSVKQEKHIEHVEVQEQPNVTPLARASKAELETTDKKQLENESRELEERIRHQQQMLDDQRKMYGTAREENKSDEDPDHISHEEPVYEKRQRQI
ncbi:MAG: hypothetical protein SCK57_06980 [Bacillota bacterium]|nr:hypothetical protein [Bacillota bacterium]MDW7677390.1 hypothetical protein [Bacillota bacterium]